MGTDNATAPAGGLPGFRLDGRRALVTGSSRGIGRAIALALAGQGARVAVHGASRAAEAEAVAARIRAAGGLAEVFLSDLAAPGAGEALAARVAEVLGGIDILVLNASYQSRSGGLTADAEIDRHVAVNLRANLALIHCCLGAMQAGGWGRILAIGSVQEARPLPQMAFYAATKAALGNLVLNFARSHSRHGITVNNLAPGVILTDRNREALADDGYGARIRAGIPAGAFGAPEDCAGAAILLCSDAGRYITGATLFVDGGMNL